MSLRVLPLRDHLDDPLNQHRGPCRFRPLPTPGGFSSRPSITCFCSLVQFTAISRPFLFHDCFFFHSHSHSQTQTYRFRFLILFFHLPPDLLRAQLIKTPELVTVRFQIKSAHTVVRAIIARPFSGRFLYGDAAMFPSRISRPICFIFRFTYAPQHTEFFFPCRLRTPLNDRLIFNRKPAQHPNPPVASSPSRLSRCASASRSPFTSPFIPQCLQNIGIRLLLRLHRLALPPSDPRYDNRKAPLEPPFYPGIPARSSPSPHPCRQPAAAANHNKYPSGQISFFPVL